MKLKIKEFCKKSKYDDILAQESIEQSLIDYFDLGGSSLDAVEDMINSTKVSQEYKDNMLRLVRGYLEEFVNI